MNSVAPTVILCDHKNCSCNACGAELDVYFPGCRACGTGLPLLFAPPKENASALGLDIDLVEHGSGPGTELKKLLKKVGIEATPNCSCNARARVMDERGIEWCEANIDEIVGWLREEATKRKLPFVDMAGRLLVRRAIKNAERAKASA